MRKEILLMVFCFAVLASISFVSAAVNSSYITVGSPTTYSFSSSNWSSSVLLNVTFQDSGTAALGSGGDLDDSGQNISIGLFNVTVTFFAKSSNGTFTTLGYISNATETANRCFQGKNATEWACWKTFTINSSLDGLWTISANITNNSGAWTNSGTNTSGNGTNVLFDSTPPRVTFLVLSSGADFAGKNYSGVLLNINVSINDSKSGTYAWTNNANDSAGILQGAVILNITSSTGQNATYTMHNVSNTNGSAFKFNYTINTSHLGGQATYTFTIWANDSLNNLNKSTAVLSLVVDLTNPTITSTRLANTTQTSMSVELLLDGSYSGLNGICTVDRTGATIGGTYLGTGSKYEYLGESGLACNTNYSYAVTCTSYAGNVGTSTFGFKTNGCSTSSGSSGSGGGTTTTTWTNTFVKSDVELSSEGVTEQLAVKNKVEVLVGGKKHSVGVTALTATSATIIISSDPVTINLNIRQDAKVDLDKDGTYDMYVKLNSIANNKADLSVTKISEAVPAGEGAVATSGEQVITPTGEGEATPTTPEKGNKWTWVIVIVLILIIIGAGVAIKNKR